MKRYTANYAFTNPNFVIQNLVENDFDLEEKAIFFVLKNILQRGCPTIMSKYLQEKLDLIGFHETPKFKEPFLFISSKQPNWIDTIKGDEDNQYYPAKIFFEEIIPNEFGAYAFIQSLILPEVRINEIVGYENPSFTNQEVDFFIPQAKLVIEIDGHQHQTDLVIKNKDKTRDNYLKSKGITVIRISSKEIRGGDYEVV